MTAARRRPAACVCAAWQRRATTVALASSLRCCRGRPMRAPGDLRHGQRGGAHSMLSRAGSLASGLRAPWQAGRQAGAPCKLDARVSATLHGGPAAGAAPNPNWRPALQHACRSRQLTDRGATGSMRGGVQGPQTGKQGHAGGGGWAGAPAGAPQSGGGWRVQPAQELRIEPLGARLCAPGSAAAGVPLRRGPAPLHAWPPCTLPPLWRRLPARRGLL